MVINRIKTRRSDHLVKHASHQSPRIDIGMGWNKGLGDLGRALSVVFMSVGGLL